MKPVRLLTLVWGQPYLDWLDRALVHSLDKPRNKAALTENVVAWDIYTTDGDVPIIKDISARLGLPVEFHTDAMGAKHDHGKFLQRTLIDQMKRCYENKQAMIMAPPDSIFGDGSIESLCVLGRPKHVCISVPHVRVKPSILEVPNRANSNALLVGAAWPRLHRTWVECDTSRKVSNTYSGGCAWTKIHDGLYAVVHRLPTTYYAEFNDTDMVWWENQVKLNVWDHSWPSKTVAELRHRCIGSSDAAFIAEVTPEFANVPPCTPVDPEEPDKYWGRAAHHVFQRNHFSIFRAETP